MPPGYCVEWNSQTRRRRGLADSKDLRSEILTEETPGMERLFVVHSLDGRVLETLSGAGGVDAWFLEAHARRKGYRPRGAVGARWWSWEYPETGRGGRDGCRGEVSLCRVSLWSSSYLTVLIVNRPEAMPPVRAPPRLRHQDTATRASRLKAGNHYGTVDGYNPSKTGPSSMDGEIYSSLGGPRLLEDVIGELVYDHWLDFLDALGSRSCRSCHDETVLWAALTSLEQNQDSSRHLVKKNRPLDTPSHSDWTDLIARVHRRLSLLTVPQRMLPPSSGRDEERDADKRSLDRISYLGGLLLPVTVVSGILAIENDYGPTGGSFWLFWVISAVASAVAVFIIYVDQVRSLHVWIEVAADAMMEDSGGEEEADEGKTGRSDLAVERLKDGELVKAWRRRELGWAGAVKKVSGYYRWRRPPGMQFEAPRVFGGAK